MDNDNANIAELTKCKGEASQEENFPVSDMRIIVTLMVHEAPIESTVRVSPGKVVFNFDRKNDIVKEIVDKRQRGIKIGVEDIDRIFDTINRFHSIVHNV
jgi:hypothetical protein